MQAPEIFPGKLRTPEKLPGFESADSFVSLVIPKRGRLLSCVAVLSVSLPSIRMPENLVRRKISVAGTVHHSNRDDDCDVRLLAFRVVRNIGVRRLQGDSFRFLAPDDRFPCLSQ